MKTTFRLAAGAVALLSLALFAHPLALGQTAPPKTSDLLSRGKKLFGEKCVSCHGEQGKGDGPMAKILKPSPRDFSQPLKNWAVTQGDPAKIYRVIKGGIPNSAMLKFDLPDEDAWALVYRIMEFSK